MSATLFDTISSTYRRVQTDPESLWDVVSEGATFHVTGLHPLSGTYVGREAIAAYVESLRRVPGPTERYTVSSVLQDAEHGLLLVQATARHGDPVYTRPVIHLLRLHGDKVVEFWDHPVDASAEDRFWRENAPGIIPQQRQAGSVPHVSRPGVSFDDLLSR